MQKFKYCLVLLLLGVFELSMATETYVPTIAFTLPKKMHPVNPVEMVFFGQQMLIGQVVDTLFSVGDDGLVKGELVQKWEFNKERTELTVFLKDDVVFSNGRPLMAQDVKATLELQQSKTDSLGASYLKNIVKIEVMNDLKVKFYMDQPNVTILKVLSRQSHGIRPKDWTFSSTSTEPFVGSGPYRLIFESGEWFYKANDNYRYKDQVKVKKWKVKFMDYTRSEPNTPGYYPLADLFWLLNSERAKLFYKNVPNIKETHQINEYKRFTQASFFWTGNKYSKFSKVEREALFNQITNVAKALSKTENIHVATGIIPQGITGSLKERRFFSTKLRTSQLTVKVAVEEPIFKDLDAILTEKSEIQNAPFRLKFEKYDHLNEYNPKLHRDKDLYLLYSMAGFYDPEGFLTSIPPLLEESPDELYGAKVQKLRRKGQAELDPFLRSEIYQNISKILVEEVRMIPGWTSQLTEVRSKKIGRKSQALRTAFRLTDYYLIDPSGN